MLMSRCSTSTGSLIAIVTGTAPKRNDRHLEFDQYGLAALLPANFSSLLTARDQSRAPIRGCPLRVGGASRCAPSVRWSTGRAYSDLRRRHLQHIRIRSQQLRLVPARSFSSRSGCTPLLRCAPPGARHRPGPYSFLRCFCVPGPATTPGAWSCRADCAPCAPPRSRGRSTPRPSAAFRQRTPRPPTCAPPACSPFAGTVRCAGSAAASSGCGGARRPGPRSVPSSPRPASPTVRGGPSRARSHRPRGCRCSHGRSCGARTLRRGSRGGGNGPRRSASGYPPPHARAPTRCDGPPAPWRWTCGWETVGPPRRSRADADARGKE
mmetsp:Transcript_7276/g.17622  ORF Transcript_7276/g.17622 Transcript_7276/m.17622 type:complete len:323 (+) Transcript_7276:1820-2788(+)